MRRSSGDPVSVRFDSDWVLSREEAQGDVVAFLHTHPEGPPSPSSRDIRTIRAWCSAFGKPLLCLIAGPNEIRGYRFDDDESDGEALGLVEMFPRGVVIGVDADGG